MLRRTKLTRLLVMIAFVGLILFGAGYFLVKQSLAVIQNNDNKIEEKNEGEQGDPIVNFEESPLSEFPGLHLRLKTEETSKYTTSLAYPFTESDELNKPIEKWIEEQEAAFMKEFENSLVEFNEENRAHLNIQVETETLADDMYGILLTSYSYIGGANGLTTVKPITIDLKENRALDLADLVDLNEESLNKIKLNLREALLKDEELSGFIDEESLDESLQDETSWKWILSKEGLTIYFSEYEVAAGAAGIVSATIAIDDLRDYINDDIARAFNLPEPPKEVENMANEPRDLDPKGKYVALTFDDGPSSKLTPEILATLKEYDAYATFFMLGSQVEYYPEVVKQVAKAGHEIANHSRSHADLTKLSTEEIKNEINLTNDKIYEITGFRPSLIRPPYGAVNDEVKKVVQNNDMSIALWSVDTLDWQSRNAKKINEVVHRDTVEGSVVLMHDIHEATAVALPQMLKALQEAGYEFVTMSELMSLEADLDLSKPFYGKN